MIRRDFIRSSALALGTLTVSHKNLFNTFFDDPWKITMLTDKIGIFTEKGGTIAFLLAKSGIVVVDSQFAEQSQHLIDELKKKNSTPFRLLINTHHHRDHTSGNISFKGIVGNVLAHENSLANQKTVAIAQKIEDVQLYPNQTFGTVWCDKDSHQEICLHYFGAAHTNGDAVIHFSDGNIAHMGDLMFNRMHPFVDRSAGASMKSWIDVLDKTTKKFDRKTTYVFGHAAEGYQVTGTRDDLSAFGDYLGNILQFVEGEIKAGKSKEELIKTTSLPFKTQWNGGEVQRPLSAAYEELTMTGK